jgi:hypothetical protein
VPISADSAHIRARAAISSRRRNLVTPICHHGFMQSASMSQFADGARSLSRAVRSRGLAMPSFRTPPRLAGIDRSIRRTATGSVVAVRTRGRPWVAVAADMVEGVIVANALNSADAVRVRGAMWSALGFSTATAAIAPPPASVPAPRTISVAA